LLKGFQGHGIKGQGHIVQVCEC